jgi:lysophospholipase L1-like esterase
MRRKVLMTKGLKSLGALLVVFCLLEALLRLTYLIRASLVEYVPIPYVLEGDYGPVPPWVDSLRLLEEDDTLVWKGRPNVYRKYVDIFAPVHTEDAHRALFRRFSPGLPAALKDHPVWVVSTNSEGFREVNFPTAKSTTAFRILCLGDSWTFGANVDQAEAYPQRLQALLRQEFPQAHFEVFNLGVSGYASYNGLKLLKTRAINLQPDLLVLAFAMNEPQMVGYEAGEAATHSPARTLTQRMSQGLARLYAFVTGHIESYRLLRYWALLVNWQPRSPGAHLQDQSDTHALFEQEQHDGKLKPWLQVSLRDYERYLLEMMHIAHSLDAGTILLYNAFGQQSPYRRVLERLARTAGVPFIDSSAVLAAAQGKIAAALEEQLVLRYSQAQPLQAQEETEAIFRVYLEERAVPHAIYIVGSHAQLGNVVPNRIAMFDDGTHGDQKAGDRVWSYAATISPGTTIFYTYTNSGAEGKWEGLDVPVIRQLRVEMADHGKRLYAPIDTFGKMYMHADPWHTNAAGNALIARAVLETLYKDARVKRYLAYLQAQKG